MTVGIAEVYMTVNVRQIIINTATGSGARIAAISIVLLTTPVLINHLGGEAFGLLTIVAALPAYAGLLDFGIGAGLVKHFTEYSEYGDLNGVRQVMTLSLSVYVLLGIVLTPIIYLLAPDVVHLLKMSEEFSHTIELSIVIMFLYLICSSIGGVFTARLISLHRMNVTAVIGLLGQIIYAALVFAVIPISPTVLTAVWLNVVPLVVTSLISYAAVLRMDKRICCNPLRISRSLIRKLFAFGGWMQLNSLSVLVNLEADKLIIAIFLNVATVTPYQIGNRLASLNRIIPFQMLMALMPSATMIQVDKTRKEDVEKFYREMSRYLMLITLMVTGFTAIIADRLIITWIGRPYPQATFIVIALGFSFAINNLTGVGTNIVKAAGQPRYEAYYAVVSMLLNIGLTIALAPTFGLAGILAGTIIGSSIGSIYFIVLFHRRFGFSWFQTMGNWLFRLVATTVLACLGLHFLQAWVSAGWSASRLAGLILLSMYGIAYLICFAIGGILFGFWSDNDIEVSRRLMLKIAHSRHR